MTGREIADADQVRWQARLAEMSPERRTYYAIMATAHTRWAAMSATKDADAELRTKIQDALNAGHPVAEVARWTRLSRERIYQIRDNRR